MLCYHPAGKQRERENDRSEATSKKNLLNLWHPSRSFRWCVYLSISVRYSDIRCVELRCLLVINNAEMSDLFDCVCWHCPDDRPVNVYGEKHQSFH